MSSLLPSATGVHPPSDREKSQTEELALGTGLLKLPNTLVGGGRLSSASNCCNRTDNPQIPKMVGNPVGRSLLSEAS